MNQIDSITRDIDHNIQVSPSRQKALAASLALKSDELITLQDELMSLQIKLNWIKTLMRTNPSSKVLAEVVAIL